MDEAERKWKTERRGGNYGAGTKEMQARNYVARKEQERKRRELFDGEDIHFVYSRIGIVRAVGGGRVQLAIGGRAVHGAGAQSRRCPLPSTHTS